MRTGGTSWTWVSCTGLGAMHHIVANCCGISKTTVAQCLEREQGIGLD